MDTSESSLMRVLRLPEIFNAIVQYLSPKNIHTLRLVNTLFLDQCSPHFSITLDVKIKGRHSGLVEYFTESALAIEEGAAMASTGRTEKTDLGQSSPLDKIQNLIMYRNRHLLTYITPEVVSILNQCRNMRHIVVKDDSDKTETPEKKSYPARMLWSSMLPVAQGGGGGGGGGSNGGGGGGGSKSNEQHWELLDLLPFEGFLFDRLESLTIEAGIDTQLNLDRFMPRLGRSCAAKTLRTLTMTASWRSSKPTEVSWEVFRDCICDLSALKTLRMNDSISITYTRDPLIDSDDGSQHKMVTHQQQVAPTVKSLKFALRKDKDPDFRLAFMSLFPNLESFELSSLNSLLDKAVEERIYSEVGCQLPLQESPLGRQYSTGPVEGHGSPPHHIPFPLLRSLDYRNFSAEDWVNSQVLRHWIQRAPNFRLASLRVSDSVNKGLHEELSAYTVSVAKISIEVTRKEDVKELLNSRLCRSLEVLEFRGQDLDCTSLLFFLEDSLKSTAVIFDEASSAPPSQPSISEVPLLRQQDLITRLPWTQTLTTICFRTLIHSPSGSKDEGDRSAAFLRSFLKLLPRLVDFEVVDPIMDLSVFEGLGRQSTTSSADDPTDTARLSERPWLTRLKVCQSKDSKDRIADTSVPDRVAPWRRQLLFQFRFLEDLVVDREKVYVGNGGYDASNCGSSVDWGSYYD